MMTSTLYAVDGITLKIGSVTSKTWRVNNVVFNLADINHAVQNLTFNANTIKLPKPFEDIHFVDMRCGVLHWQLESVSCQRGHVKIQSKHWQSPAANFTFTSQDGYAHLTLTSLSLAKGVVSIEAKIANDTWQVSINAKQLDSQVLKHYLPSLPVHVKAGHVSVKLTVSGRSSALQQLNVTTVLDHVQIDNESGRFATEHLNLISQLKAENKQGVWQWQDHSRFTKGAIYADPIYVAVTAKPIIFNTQGIWRVKDKRITVQKFTYQHPDVGMVTGSGELGYGKKTTLEKAELLVTSIGLSDLFVTYIKPFFDPTTVEGLSLDGKAKAQFTVDQQALTATALDFKALTINDTKKRLRLKHGSGVIKWARSPSVLNSSYIAWQQLSLFNLPIGASKLFFNGWSNTVRLAYPSHLPLLGGRLEAHDFSWQGQLKDEPDISFSGHIDDVSLEKLAHVLHWTPLVGSISGHIPRVVYHDKTLHLGGELSINVFGGNIKLTNLASSKLFSDFPIVYTDFELENLDLDQITRKFQFGNITGRLSGYVKHLILENWRPTGFFAWLGTPNNDTSSHRISQKAVNNIASIGGGGVTDILSRSFLSLFDTFGYDDIGMGCYLHNGVCQIMGVAPAAKDGFYLITGGGMPPRIDVLGYNSRVDWNVLIERLSRISTTDTVVK